MDISIIIINYKSTALVLDCIESIYKHTKEHRFEIILVDNNSGDNCQQEVQNKYPETIWLQMGYNAGFGRANNAGFDIAKGEFVLLLNADTVILDGAIDKCCHLLKKHPEASGAGVQLLHPDLSNQISGAYNIKGGLNSLLPLPYTGELVRWLGYASKSKVPSITHFDDATDIDWIVGAFIMVKRNALDKSGYFDPDFFMYSEEIEWCHRLQKNGRLLLFSEPKVIHLLGGTSNDYYKTTENENGRNVWNKKGRQIIVSNMLRIRKQMGLFWLSVNAGVYLFNIPVFFVCLLFDKLIHFGKAKFSWADFGGYVKNMLTLASLLPRMIIHKPYFYKVS
ncbi:MAG: glycosyltransferase family 2 protein [Bacteroidota bacterium]